MRKSVEKIRDEWCDMGVISSQSMKDLIWHLEEGPNPETAISLIADAKIFKLAPLVAKHLDNEDYYTRSKTIYTLLCALRLPQYAAIGLKMAKEDEDSTPQLSAIGNIGYVFNEIEPKLRKEVAEFLYHTMLDPERYEHHQRAAFESILEAMGINVYDRIYIPFDEEHELILEFKKKFDL